ncbi:MAG TPA: hypothetical protein VM513_26250 [Kofleriaceae bacterium]|nr:hypothetical protein [Kofleriaceae bacterium]
MRHCLALIALLGACKVKDPPAISSPFYDGFERASLGDNYRVTGDGYRIVNGQMSAKGAHNHPLWLARKLPRNVRIEFDTFSTEARGDIKVEVFGDGRSFDRDGGAYKATGYEVIFGGWHNTKSIIARLDEHGKDLVQRTDVKVVPNRHYYWRIERDKTGVIRWWITDRKLEPGQAEAPFLELNDPNPLEGPGHEFFAFNNWETDTWFDNLVITPL